MKKLSLTLLFGLAYTLLFSSFSYEIDEFNSRVRTLIRNGKFSIRHFDRNGIPVSNLPRTGETVVSPFYVVHYGILNSESTRQDDFETKLHWRLDPSLKFWNEPPDSISKNQFKIYADWIVSNVETLNGQAHLVYKFDWRYKGYPNNLIQAPWYSGLTDAYAIIPLLRANDVFKDERYLETAGALYKSALSKMESGGSMSSLGGHPWIEEYVDPRIPPEEMAFVLNGMIYATHGIESYEKEILGETRQSDLLKESISLNFQKFSTGYWSNYDLIGTSSNIKYHRIHTSLITDYIETKGSYGDTLNAWKIGARSPGLFWILSKGWPIAKIQLLLTYLGTLIIGIRILTRLFHSTTIKTKGN